MSKNNIIFLDVTNGYGYAFSASNTKVNLISKGLTEQGDTCVIHNGLVGLSNLKDRSVIFENGVGKIISLPKRGGQLISWIRNLRTVYHDLKSCHRKDSKNTVVLEYADYHIFLADVIMAKLAGYNISVISHEWAPTADSVKWYRKPYVWIYSLTFGYFADSILPISEYIIQKITHFKKPYYKLPILGDYSQPCVQEDCPKGNYFVYCGASDYYRVILVLLDSMLESRKNFVGYKLLLILGGTESGKEKVKEAIRNKQLEDMVEVMTNVNYKTLMTLYHKAQALLIPLDPQNKQDHARFSQKIAEYLSTATPIITNNVGEIPYYFTNKKNIICCDYSKESFSNAMKWVVDNPIESKMIGVNGFQLGEREFNYKIHGQKLHLFFLDPRV